MAGASAPEEVLGNAPDPVDAAAPISGADTGGGLRGL